MKPQIIAHRGGSYNWPENTLLAFKESQALGVFAIELDLQLSRDGVPVAYRPKDLSKLTEGRGQIADMDSPSLQRLDASCKFSPGKKVTFGDGDTSVPALGTILREIPQTMLILDMKARNSDDLVRALADQVPEAEWRRIAIYSTNSDDLRLMGKLKPDAVLFEDRAITRERLLECRLNHKYTHKSKSHWVGFELDWTAYIVEDLARGQETTRMSVRLWSEQTVSCVREMAPGAKIVFFGVNTAEQYQVARMLGADAVYTDDPRLLTEVGTHDHG